MFIQRFRFYLKRFKEIYTFYLFELQYPTCPIHEGGLKGGKLTFESTISIAYFLSLLDNSVVTCKQGYVSLLISVLGYRNVAVNV